MSHKKVAVPLEMLGETLWPGMECRIRIEGVKFDTVRRMIILDIVGDSRWFPDDETEWVAARVVKPSSAFFPAKDPSMKWKQRSR
jgi:hypothetical protein